jgi:SPP1 family predicted phage head-tail adaptor
VIGKFNQRAALLRKAQVADGGGGFAESWQSFANLWVSLAAQNGGEVYGPDAMEAQAKYRVELRRRTDVAAGQRLQIGTRLLDIKTVQDAGPQTPNLTLICEEIP